MITIKSINIPTPCHESWQQMTPTDQGRHCQLCCKTVTDFTSMSNNEIIAYLTSAKNVCGRFGEQQLTDINHHLYAQTPPASAWKRWVMMIGLLGSTIFFKASAQTKPATVQTMSGQSESKPEHFLLGKVAAPDSNRYRVISGRVTDDNKNPLSGAIVKIKGTNAQTIIGADGKFTLHNLKPTDTVVFAFVGFESQEIKVGSSINQTYNVVMKAAFMGEVVVIKQQSPVKKVIHKVKRIFN